jgi:hypothetical protein
MDVGIAILTSVLASSGFFGLLQFFITRHDNKARDNAQIKAKLDTIAHKCDRNELATTRLQLIFLIEAHPENKDTILQTAQRYFVELDGNGEAWSLFHIWAEKNGIDTGWYNALIKRKKGSDA